MRTFNRAVALCLTQFALVSQAHSADLKLPRDGWASWQVEAVEGAPAWCCWSSWDDRAAETTTCPLDGHRQGYGNRDHATTDTVRIYARFAGGKVERLRALAASCPVEAKTPIQKLDNVATDDSARWLSSLTLREDLDDDVLAALGMHRGDLAFNALAAMARGDARQETRKQAVFWLSELRGEPGADLVTSVMFGDKDPALRQHAAFAIAQGKSTHAAENLIRQGNTDKDGEVRAQAWFWLAQTESPGAEDAIVAALRKDTDDHVREQAIFALSQLPEERATRALIKAAEDKTLSSEQRKRAIFWLAQSESEGAQKYLEKVLTVNTTH